MQDVTQKKLKRQELKKWTVVVAVLVLALSFLLGAILISNNTFGKADAATTKTQATFSSSGADGTFTYYVGSSQGGEAKTSPATNYWSFSLPYDNMDLGNQFEPAYAFNSFVYNITGTNYHTLTFTGLTVYNAATYTSTTDSNMKVVVKTSISDNVLTVTAYSVGSTNMALTYSPAQGITTNSLICYYNAKGTPEVALPAEPTAPEGQHFVGWYYDEALTNAYKDGDVITADTQLYAKFAVNAYTVTYMVNGVQYSTSELEHGAAIANVVPTGVTTGKQFSGWFTDAACTQAYDFTTGNAITGDITLYGNIETVMLTVTFYVGTEVYTTLEVPYGSTLVKLAESNATAAAVLRVFNFAENSQIVAETEITDDVAATGTLDEKTVNWINTGAWFDANWPWLVACVGVVIIIIAGSVILAKKRR